MRRDTPSKSTDDTGCAFVLDGAGTGSGGGFCGAPRRSGSAYCTRHHARCHLANGSRAETRRLREIEALAAAIGGRQGREARQPPTPLLRRLARAERASSRPDCS